MKIDLSPVLGCFQVREMILEAISKHVLRNKLRRQRYESKKKQRLAEQRRKVQ